MPRKPLEPLTEEAKYKLELQQEQELQRFQRQYNHLERDRQFFTSGVKLNRLNRVLSVFKVECQNIQTDLEVAGASSKKRQDRKDSEYLAYLLDHYDFYNEEVQNERQHIVEIEDQIRTVEKGVVELRTKQVTDRQIEDRIVAARKTVEGLWNKLDVQNSKFGTICAKNRAMKQEIRRMLWERDVFMKVWNKMINKLVLGKKFMMDLIEQATIAYDQREEWCSKLQALRMKAHHDYVLHIQEMRELKRKQDNNVKLEEFFNLKGQKRVMKDLKEKEMLKRMENTINIKVHLHKYREFMEDILQFTRESQVEEIARKYYLQEAENLSLFKRVNDLTEELECLNEELENLHSVIDEEKALNSARIHHQDYSIRSLEHDRELINQELQKTQNENQQLEIYIQNMLSGIDKLFQICRCDKDPILRLLGDNTTVNVYNVFLYIEMIEDKIHQALVEVYHDEKSMYDKKRMSGGQRMVFDNHKKPELKNAENIVATSPCPLCVEHEVVSDLIDGIYNAMTRSQAKLALEERLQTAEYAENLHNVSACFLPQSRDIIQRRYQ